MDQSPNAIGCWRAHLNVAQRIVREGVATAFVFEDDADWDVAFKQQLVQFARGARVMLQTPDHQVPSSPYGDGWDILWIGHCGTWVYPERRRPYFVIPNDPTVEPPQHRQNVEVPDMSHWEGPGSDNRTRIVFKAGGGVCTAGYAISQQGARKVLYQMSMEPYNKPVDWGFANLCENKHYNFRCISVFPQLVGVSRPQGNTSKWSDIGYGSDSERKVENANSQHLVYSTRLNMGNLLAGKAIFDSQYPDSTPARMDIKKIGAAVGHVEVVNVED
jgi:GR25 family glycosyltransferase involved in LPS biosynthesis